MFGKEATEELEVTAVEPGRSYVVESRGRGAHYRSERGVEPDAVGESRLWVRFGAAPEGLLGRVMAATVGRLFQGSTRRMLMQDLNEILAMVEKLQELDTANVDPLVYVNEEEMENAWREDEVSGQVSREDALARAPARDEAYFRVPKVIDL